MSFLKITWVLALVCTCRKMNEWGMMEEFKWASNWGLVMGVLTESVSFNHTDPWIQTACTSGWIWVPAWMWTECEIEWEFWVRYEINANLKNRWMVMVHLFLCVSFLTFLYHFRWAQGMSIISGSFSRRCNSISIHDFMLCLIIEWHSSMVYFSRMLQFTLPLHHQVSKHMFV